MAMNKQIVEEYFSERADLEKTKEAKNGTLFFWKSAESIPSVKAVLFVENTTGKVCLPNRCLEEFREFFATVSLFLESAEDICEIIQWSSPYLLRPIRTMAPYLECIKDEWHKPEVLNKGRFQAYFDNASEGYVERITLENGIGINTDRRCEGIRL
jgi:hypothetical protein